MTLTTQSNWAYEVLKRGGNRKMNQEALSQLSTNVPLVSDDTSGVPTEQLESHWLNVLAKHKLVMGDQVRVFLPGKNKFEARADSGFVGSLGYSCLSIKPSVLLFPSVIHRTPISHWVVLQISGKATYTTSNRSFGAMPGDVVLINRSGIQRVEYEGHTELIVLHKPLASTTLRMLQSIPNPIRHSSSELVRIAFRLCQDLVPSRPWMRGELGDDLGAVITRLMGHVFCELPTLPFTGCKNKVIRQDIENHVMAHLEDPSLSLVNMANALGCSLRTLHRSFKQERDGEGSLEGYIWKMRVEACATQLRVPDARPVPLTELALRYGFANSSHFSSVFRRWMGISPSHYRKTYGQHPMTQHMDDDIEHELWPA